MKKTIFILALILCGLIGLQAQKATNPVFMPNTETLAKTHSSIGTTEKEDYPKFSVNGKTLTAKNLENGSQVDIYSVLGSKVFTFTYTGNPVILNLNKGIYIIKSDKYTQKIML